MRVRPRQFSTLSWLAARPLRQKCREREWWCGYASTTDALHRREASPARTGFCPAMALRGGEQRRSSPTWEMPLAVQMLSRRGCYDRPPPRLPHLLASSRSLAMELGLSLVRLSALILHHPSSSECSSSYKRALQRPTWTRTCPWRLWLYQSLHSASHCCCTRIRRLRHLCPRACALGVAFRPPHAYADALSRHVLSSGEASARSQTAVAVDPPPALRACCRSSSSPRASCCRTPPWRCAAAPGPARRYGPSLSRLSRCLNGIAGSCGESGDGCQCGRGHPRLLEPWGCRVRHGGRRRCAVLDHLSTGVRIRG